MAKKGVTITVAVVALAVLLLLIYTANERGLKQTPEGSAAIPVATFNKEAEENILLDNKRDVSLIYASNEELYFTAINEVGKHNLYVFGLTNRETTQLDENIELIKQCIDGYIYYTKSIDLKYKTAFRRLEIGGKLPEDVDAVNNGVTAKEGYNVIFSSAYAYDEYFYNSLWIDTHQYCYIVKYNSHDNAEVICDYLFPPNSLMIYKDTLYFDGINLSEDGIYSVPIDGGGYRMLYSGATTLLNIDDGRIYFSCKNGEGIDDLNYISINGGAATKLFAGNVGNFTSCGTFVYFLNKDDSDKIIKLNVATKEKEILTDGRVKDFIINESKDTLYYQKAYLSGSEILKITISNDDNGEALIADDSLTGESDALTEQAEIENYNLLDIDGDIQYAWRPEGRDCVLYTIADDGSSAKRLAAIPPGDTPAFQNSIVDFGICGDWLIACVGEYQGSGNFFYGDFVRLKKDGSELEHFWLTDDDNFIIIEDWIYYNFWELNYNSGAEYGCHRIRPDGTGKEYLGNSVNNIYFYSEDGYVYGDYATEDTVNGLNPVIDFIRCKPDGNGTITLIKGESLPKFDSSDYIRYYDIEISDTVSFAADVHGYTEGDSWRGHNIYTAKYRVNKDGSNLTLLSEVYSN